MRVFGVSVLLCIVATSCGASESADGSLKTVNVGGEIVAVAPYKTDVFEYPDLNYLVGEATVIAEGTVKATNALAAEYQPKDSEEGVVAGEGRDVYGTIEFDVTSVIKGSPALKEIAIVYPSGKRDSQNRKRRIAFQHDGLAQFQTENAGLKTPTSLSGSRYLIFAVPNTFYPVKADAYVPAHPYAIARILPDGRLLFQNSEGHYAFQGADHTSVTEVRAAV